MSKLNLRLFIPRLGIVIMVIIASGCVYNPLQKSNYPLTRKDTSVVDDYFGIKINDPYRWLEDDQSGETKYWVKKQNAFTFEYLNKIPFRQKIHDRLTELWNYPKYSVPFRKAGREFYYKNDGLQNQSVLYIKEPQEEEATVLIDPNTFSEDGTVALKGVYLSGDGRYLGYAISSGGSDWQEFYVHDLDRGEKLDDHIQWAKFSGMSWYRNGFYYNRFPKPKPGDELTNINENSSIYYHRLGTPQSSDELIFQDSLHPKQSPWVEVTEDEQYLILYRSKGTHGTSVKFMDLTREKPEFIPLVDDYDHEHGVITTEGRSFIMWTTLRAPKKRVVKIDPEHLDPDHWQTIIPETEDVLESVTTAGGRLFGHYLHNAGSLIRVFSLDGTVLDTIGLPAPGLASGFNGNREDTDVYYSFTSFTYPQKIYRYDFKTGASVTVRKSRVAFTPEEYRTEEVFYPGKDGTPIHLFIVHKKGLKLDGNNPTLLYGYGGFNISMKPYFSTSTMVLLEKGGVYALANLRGGGEFGEAWHKAGMLENKQNVFDDFIAAAEYLIRQGYTSPEKLAIRGGSNGGLLIGAVLNQRPELFRVAFPAVGVMDMLRYHKFTIGWAWAVEYGTSDKEKDFKNLITYSPLHNIRSGVSYPATLITTADHDDRVVPAHSFKYAATLQEKNRGPNPILIRIETRAGHGAGKPTTKIIDELTDMWSFMFYNMGLSY